MSKKVLLIDENLAILTFMAKRLKSENVETLTADNGADGLRMVQTLMILEMIGQESKRHESGGFEARSSKLPSPSLMCGH